MFTAARIGVTTYATPSDREIVVTRLVDAPRRLVFDAMSNPKHVPQWLTGPEGGTKVMALWTTTPPVPKSPASSDSATIMPASLMAG